MTDGRVHGKAAAPARTFAERMQFYLDRSGDQGNLDYQLYMSGQADVLLTAYAYQVTEALRAAAVVLKEWTVPHEPCDPAVCAYCSLAAMLTALDKAVSND